MCMACKCFNASKTCSYTCDLKINPVCLVIFYWLISGKLYLTYFYCRTVGRVMVEGAADVRVVNVSRNGKDVSAKFM